MPPASQYAIGATVSDLYLRHRAELCAYVLRTFGPGTPEPEDIIQLAFERYAALADATAILNPRAFLYRIVHNLAIEQLRREGTRAKLDGQYGETSRPATDDLDGERVLLAKERYRILEQAIRGMEPTRQKLLIMHRIHELSFAEISRRTGISQTQVKRLVADAILECNAALERAFGDAEP